MSYTNFPNGLTSFGMPIIGSMPYGMKAESRIWFVDQQDGNDGNDGLNPETAFQYISRAILKASNFDVIYCLAQGYTTMNDPTPFRETAAEGNLVIPYAMDNVSLVGAGHLGFGRKPVAPQIKGASGATTAVLSVRAPYVNIENLAFNRGSSTTGGIYTANEGDQVTEAMGTTIYNCYFRNLRGAGATNGGAIFVEGIWQANISNCYFHNNRVGVYAISGTNTLTELLIQNCIFTASAASNVSVDIYVYAQGTCDFLIKDCDFAHDQPAYSGGALYFINTVGGAEVGHITGCSVGALQVVTSGEAGTGFRTSSSDVTFGDNYADSALMAAAE